MEDPDNAATEPAEQRRRGVWPAIALVIVLTALAVWLVPDDGGEPEMPAIAPLPRPEPAPAEPPGPPAVAEEAQPTTEPPSAEGEYARTFIAGQRDDGTPDLTAAYAEAERLRSEERLTDAWLIHFYAARQGHAPSALVLGTLSDPTYHAAGMGALDEPDPAQALKWYRVAADAGDTEAARRLSDLHARLQQAADDGDAAAQRLLLQFQ